VLTAATFATKRITVLRRAPAPAAPVEREEMDVRCRQVNCTHAGRGGLSMKSEISFSLQVEKWLGTTSLRFVGLAAGVFTIAAYFFFEFPAAR
jgi:hypothetical protein